MTVMVSESLDMVFEVACKLRLDSCSGPRMDQFAPLDQHRAVRDLLRERVLEGVLDLSYRRLLVDELRKLQRGEWRRELIVGLARHRAYQAEPELLANHRDRLQEVLLGRRQPIDARGQHRLHGRGYLDRIEGPHDSRRSVPYQRTIFDQPLHDLFHEERV